MSVTAIVTNHNYGRYLEQCLESAMQFCDVVRVYDDGSTDNSLEICNQPKYDGIYLEHRAIASGDPVWGSNMGIEDTTTSHLIFLDSDNFLIDAPPQNDCDYTFANIESCLEDGSLIEMLNFRGWSTDSKECLRKFIDTKGMPFPWGGVWRTDFVRDLRWRRWKDTGYAADWRTAVDWCLHNPTIQYEPTPFMAFRNHDGQWSSRNDEAEKCFDDAQRTADRLRVWL